MSHVSLTKYDLEQIDVLVDGDLQEPFYSQLLLRIDQVPEGWKTCALAFLEQQALAKDFQQFRQEDFSRFTPEAFRSGPRIGSLSHRSTEPVANPVKSPSPQPSVAATATLHQSTTATVTGSHSRHRFGSFMAIAAATLLSFTAGWQLRIWNEVTRSEPTGIATNSDAQLATQSSNAIDPLGALNQQALESLAQHGLDPAKTFTIDPRPKTENPSLSEHPTNFGEIATVSPYAEAFDFPLQDKFEKRLVRFNSSIDAEMERHQTLVPYTTEDGSEVMVPVQSMRLRPIAIHGF